MNSSISIITSALHTLFKYIISCNLAVHATRIFYSTGIIYAALYLTFEILLKDLYNTEIRLARISREAGALSVFPDIQGALMFVIPSLLVAAILAGFYFFFKIRKGMNYAKQFFASWLIMLAFAVITISTALASGDIRGVQIPTEIGYSRILAFMIVYAIPITISITLSEEKDNYILVKIALFLMFSVISNLLYVENHQTIPGVVLSTFNGIGIFYFTATLIALVSVADYITADMDTDIRTTLLYLLLPVFLLISFFLIGILALSAIIYRLTGIQTGMELLIPFEYIYFYLRGMIHYADSVGFMTSITTVASLALASLILFKKAVADYDGLEGLHLIRTLAGTAVIAFFISRSLPIPWYFTTPAVTALIIAAWIFARKLFCDSMGYRP